MNSAKVAQQVVQRLDLTQDPRFLKAPSLGASSTGGLFAFLERLSLAMSGGGQSLLKSLFSKIRMMPKGNPLLKLTGWRDVSANSWMRNDDRRRCIAEEITNVRRRGLTNVIALDVTINNPKDAARLANAYADIYIDEEVNAKFRAGRSYGSSRFKRYVSNEVRC